MLIVISVCGLAVGTTVGDCSRLMVEGTMSKQVVIVKLGGSSITDKSKWPMLPLFPLSACRVQLIDVNVCVCQLGMRR